MNIRIVQAVSSVHLGDGSAMGAIDLPVLREHHTGWPMLAGSSAKAALRQRARVMGASAEIMQDTFGSEPPTRRDVETHLARGRVSFGPAVLLALPVRCLAGGFALLTCPLALGRFARAATLSLPIPAPPLAHALVDSSMLQTFATRQRNDKEGTVELVFEDLDWIGVAWEDAQAWRDALSAWTADDAPLDHLVVVHDDLFAHACNAWLPLRTRARIGESGVVEDGGLFTVEEVPPDTLWWAWTLEDTPDDPIPRRGETWIVGGHTTTGSGRVAWYPKEVSDAS